MVKAFSEFQLNKREHQRKIKKSKAQQNRRAKNESARLGGVDDRAQQQNAAGHRPDGRPFNAGAGPGMFDFLPNSSSLNGFFRSGLFAQNDQNIGGLSAAHISEHSLHSVHSVTQDDGELISEQSEHGTYFLSNERQAHLTNVSFTDETHEN